MHVRRYPARSFVTGITLGIWAFVFAAIAAELLLDLGLTAYSAGRVIGHFGSSLLGAGMCFALSPWLRRARLDLGTMAGLLILACAACAIVWLTISRLVIFPATAQLLEVAGWAAEAQEAPRRLALFWIAVVFAVWAGAWMAVTFADELRESEIESSRRQEKIIELESILRESTDENQGRVQFLWVPSRLGQTRIPADELVTVSAERDYVRLKSVGGREYLVRGPLQRLLGSLDPDHFVQVHRGVAVNVIHVRQIRREGKRAQLVLADGSEVVVSRRFLHSLRSVEEWPGAALSSRRAATEDLDRSRPIPNP